MSDPQVTRILNDISAGRPESAGELLPLVYQQLRAIAQQRMNGERKDHTLQATALVHEAYVKLVGPREIPWANRAHFYVAAAEAMRRILLDHAKARAADKRGGGSRRVDFASVAHLAMAEDSGEFVSFDEALRRLEGENPDAAAVVRLRFFAGLSVDDTARVLGVSDRTVNRQWLYARAWLHRAMAEHIDGA